VVNLIVMIQTFYLLNCRSRTRSIFAIGFLSNRWLIAGIAVAWLAQAGLTYLPMFNRLFHTAPVRAEAWLYIGGIGILAFIVVELEKWRRSRAMPGPEAGAWHPSR
jgi:magnesium-transporting ATPase (P-type)